MKCMNVCVMHINKLWVAVVEGSDCVLSVFAVDGTSDTLTKRVESVHNRTFYVYHVYSTLELFGFSVVTNLFTPVLDCHAVEECRGQV